MSTQNQFDRCLSLTCEIEQNLRQKNLRVWTEIVYYFRSFFDNLTTIQSTFLLETTYHEQPRTRLD